MTTTTPALARLGTRPRLTDYIKTMWQRREFALAVPRAELESQHRNTLLGSVWHLLDPFILVGVYYLVFGVLITANRGVDNVVGFLAIGVFIWHFTTKSVKMGAKSIATNEGLVRAIAFPRAVLPLAAVLAEFYAFLFALVAMFGSVIITGEEVAWTWLLTIPIVLLQLLFNVGLGMIFARVAERFRDILQVLPYTLRVVGYMSGVLFPVGKRLAQFPTLKTMMDYNPAYLLMNMTRQAVLYNTVPSSRDWAVMTAWAVGLLCFGFLYFIGREHEYGRA